MSKTRRVRERIRARAYTPSPGTNPLAARLTLGLLLAAAASVYGWNGYTLPPFIGYDAWYHADYIATIAEDGHLPEPLTGWSTFHPPFYYLVAGLVWALAVPDDVTDRAQVALLMLGLRAISSLGILLAGAVAFWLVLRRSGNLWVTGAATALVLFVPCTQLAAVMVGNEAWGVGVAALALPALLRLQRNPRDLRAAAVAGLMAGLALATKYTGVFVACACVVPFLRAGIDRRMLHTMVLGGVLGATVAAPVYVRNMVLTGSPVPMTRNLEPMKSEEAKFVIRERRIYDYLWINPESLWRPSIYHVKGAPAARENRNPAMANVWGLAYAGMWYDAFGHRVPALQHADGQYTGPLLTLLGLVPTAVMGLGFVLALCEWIRRRSAAPDAPLVAMSLLGLGAFIAFTWRAPSAAAVKAAYLLPLVVPAALFYARGMLWLRPHLRTAALLVSGAAALAAFYVFANGLGFWPGTSYTPSGFGG